MERDKRAHERWDVEAAALRSWPRVILRRAQPLLLLLLGAALGRLSARCSSVVVGAEVSVKSPYARVRLAAMSSTERLQLWDPAPLPRARVVALPAAWPDPPPSTAALATGQSIPRVSADQVCVLQADSRPLQPYRRPDAYFLDARSAPMSMQTASALYNYAWALRHGYTFVWANSTAPTDWDPMWAKVRPPAQGPV